MADILIRGMEMPRDGHKHTAVIQFLEDGKCRAIVEYSKSYDDRSVKVFEAVPLPAGHGRLGDLDKLQEEFKKYHDGKRLMLIDTAPTIVPAEGGTDDG